MDIIDFINGNGQRTIANPNYNPKSKKNKEPRSIVVPDIFPVHDEAIEMARRDAVNQFSIASGEADKYRRFGINYNPRENLDSLLAERQSNWSKLTNALGQTLVSEIGLGTLRGLSDLYDFVSGAPFRGDNNYSNPVSQYLEQKQEEFRNYAPVYTDPEKNITNGGLADFGWWMSNLPSIASSLTLLIPSTGVTKGLSWLGKASKVSKYTNRAARAVANPLLHAVGKSGLTSAEAGVYFETGLNAFLSRTMENYQEARQTYNDVYTDMSSSLKGMSPEEYNTFVAKNKDYLEDNNVDINNRDDVAKQLAKTSADRTFQLDYANVIFDAYQIYGLRNMLTHAPRFNGSAATRAAQRESIRTAGMDAEKAAAEMAKDSKWTKARHWLSDRFIGAGRQIKSELSEGVEEAINYIAQQEGTHLGKYILEGNPEDAGPMTQRILNDYINDAGLWDSAFWGVLGGVVFQAGGSGLNRVSQTIKNRQEAKNSANQDNETTKEAKLTPHWWQLDQLSETERMVGDIKGRNVKLQSFRTNMQKINSGKNPYIKKEDGTEQDISSPVEERMLREKAYTEYLDELIINARNNGTLRMLDAYINDENVKQAISEAYRAGDENNSISKEEADAAAEKATSRIKHIDNLYQNEILHASNIADKIGDKNNRTLPAEYVQMIASSNVRHRLNLERYDEVAALYNEDTDRIKEVVGDKLDSSIDYQGLISLKSTIQELSQLVAEKKELEAKQKETPTLSRQFEIEELNNQIGIIKKKALQTSTDAQFARTLYALHVANSAVREYSPDGKQFKVTSNDVDLISNLDNLLINDLSYVFDETGTSQREISTDAVLGELRKLSNDVRYILPTPNAQSQDVSQYLDNIDPKLSENYEILSRIELEKIKELSKIAETEKEITHYVDAINNIENVARKRAIEEQFNNLAEIQRKHKDMNLLYVMNNIYNEGNNADFLVDTNSLTEEERNQIKEAKKVLNIADVKNRSLFDRLAETLVMVKATQAQVEANDKQNSEETENSSTSQNTNSEQQNVSTVNISTSAPQQSRTQGNGQISNVSSQNGAEFVTLSQDGNNKLVAKRSNTNNTPSDIPVRSLGNGMFELTFTAKDGNVRTEDINNATLFEFEETPMDGGVITRNPIVKFNAAGEVEVVSQGLVQNPVKSNINTDAVNTALNDINNNPTLKNNLNSSDEETRRKAIDSIKRTYNLNNDELNQVLGKVNATPSIPSTGVLEQSIDTSEEEETKTKEPEAPVNGADPLEYIPKITSAARNAAISIKDGNQITYEDYIGSLADVRAAINNDEEFERLAKEAWNRSMQRLAKKYPEIVDNIINSLQSSTTEEAPNSNLGYRFKTSFKKEVEKLVKAYLKDIKQKPSNGKYVISLENLLRFCNGEFQNNENASLLYNVLSNYLLSDEAKDKYEVIESKDEVSSPTFLDKVKTPLEERIDKAIREDNHRINTTETKDKEVFDQLEQGQELSTEREKDRIYFTFDGKRVGYIGIPKVVNNVYSSPYGYFLFNIRPEGKDNYYSKIAQVFKSIANAETGDLKEIKDAALAGGIDLKDNKTWQAIKKEYGINTIDPKTGEEYDDVDKSMLETIRTMCSFSVRYGSADKAIDGWFNNLVQEYMAAQAVAENAFDTVVVDAITDGFLIKAVDRVDNNSNTLPFASEAIGPNHKGKVSIAIGSRKNAGTVSQVVKKDGDRVIIPANYSFPGVGYSNTFVAIPASNDKVLYAQAYPVLVKDLKSGSPAIKIVDAFSKEITRRLEEIASNPNNTQLLKDLQDFLFEALNYKNSTTPLFHTDNCEKISNGDSRGTHIGTNGRQGQRRDLRIFCNPGNIHVLEIDKTRTDITLENLPKIAKDVRAFINDTIQFNISENYIASDNNIRNQVTGLATRNKDGKFVINIGKETFTFDSYNDFMLDNDLVRVNTRPNEYGNNFTRTSSNPNVRYKIVTSSPVEESITSTQNVDEDISTQATNIINSDRKNKASAIANLIFDDNTVSILDKYDLLPHNLVFDKDFNTGEGRDKLNASFNISNKVTTIGPRFMAMLSHPNPAYRKQAIRKLIHERLHDIIHSDNNEHYVKDIKNIFEQFVQYNKDNNAEEKFTKYEYRNKKTEEERLEEFLVDSLTSQELANYLNSITSLSKVNMRERKRDTLLNKIMRVLAKIMGINIKNNSLYAQEFEALRKAVDSNAELTIQFEEEKIIEKEETVEEKSSPIETNSNIYQNLSEPSEDDDEYASDTTENYEDVASIADYIQSYSPEDRAEIAREINNGEISIKCK